MARRSYLAGSLVLSGSLLGSLGCAHGSGHSTQAAMNAELGLVPSGVAQVCVVRPDALAAHLSMPIRDNGRLVGATRGTTFFCYLARTGEHQITSSDDDTGPMLLRARAGMRYFIHQDVTELGGAVHAHLDWVDDATALEMVDACEARVRVAVPGHDDEPFAQPIAPAISRR